MECPNCGQENRILARFCQHCGASLALPEPEPEDEVQPPTPGQEWPEGMTGPGAVAPEDETEMETSELASDRGPVDEASLSPVAAADVSGVATVSPSIDAGSPAATDCNGQAPDSAVPGSSAAPSPSDLTELTTGETEEPYTDAVLTIDATLDGTNPSEPPMAGDAPATAEPESTSDSQVSLSEPAPVPQPEAEMPEDQASDQPGEEDAPAVLRAHEPGTVIQDRYRIVQASEVEPTFVRYTVRDLQRCPRCGATGHSPDEAFCRSCGALMDQKPIANMLHQPEAAPEPPAGIEPEDHVVEDGQSYWIWRDIPEQEPMKDERPLMRMIVGLQSDTGQVRELDEDSMFVLTMSFTFESVTHQLGLFVVADGMGGHEGGEVASRAAIQISAQVLLRDLFGPELAGNALSAEEILSCLSDAIRQANDEVYLERQKRENDMGTTLTAGFVKDWTLYLGHVGDCRAYLWGEAGLQQLTEDHSIVAGMVAAGTIQPEDIYTHPQRSVIYRCIGDQPTVEVDVGTIQVEPGERLVVCCDGLWEMLHNSGIEDILLAEADPQAACDQMVLQANLAGGSDNISVIIVQL